MTRKTSKTLDSQNWSNNDHRKKTDNDYRLKKEFLIKAIRNSKKMKFRLSR